MTVTRGAVTDDHGQPNTLVVHTPSLEEFELYFSRAIIVHINKQFSAQETEKNEDTFQLKDENSSEDTQ